MAISQIIDYDKIYSIDDFNQQDRDFWNWFAGFWEGEGSLCFSSAYKRKDSTKIFHRGRLTISQVSKQPLEYIKEFLKLGYVVFARPANRNINWNDRGIWVWSVDKRRDIIFVLQHMLPFLRFKKEKVLTRLRQISDYDKKSQWRSWTKYEINFLRQTYSVLDLSLFEVSKSLNRPYKAVIAKANKIGLRRYVK